MPLFRRKKETRLHQIGEKEAYGRSYGEVSGDVKIVKVEPRRPRYQLKITGEGLRKAFLDRLNRREPRDRPDRDEQMILQLVLWNLADSMTTIEELRRYLREESVDTFEEVPGLRFKAWISDEATERWGAVYLWESEAAAAQTHGVQDRARELIGKEPDIGEEFDVEATIEGQFEIEELSRLGLAFEN